MVVPTVISTFAGCGGSSLGYKLAGFHELLAVEWDDNAVETFKLNFPDVPVYHGDIVKLTGVECMRLAGIKPGELDVLDGSPPCQGFSTAGKRKFDDPRNSLFKEFSRLLKELQPKVFVMENVTGMVKGYMKQVYLVIIKTLRDCGYQAKGEILNAMYFNVAQSRERVIIIGVRKDLGIEPSHPKPQGRPVTVGEVIRNATDKIPAMRLGKLETKIPFLKPGEGLGRANARMGRKSQSGNSTKRLSWNRPSNTINKTISTGLGGLIHPDENRYLSISELQTLASFPHSFRFVGKPQKCWARIGNSVPPNLMRAIAEHIRQKILKK